MMMSRTIRSVAVTTFLAAAAASAHADLKIPFGWTNSNSVQKFPTEVLDALDLLYIRIAARGNTTSLGDIATSQAVPNAASYSFPVTEIVIGSKLNIAAGSAAGSALEFSRNRDETDGAEIGVTLSNFTLDYVKKQVFCDAKPFGGASKRIAIYDFHVATPLALKYKFPLTVTGHEVLDQLKLTADGKAVYTAGLELPDYTLTALELDYGTLTQDISTKTRKPKLASTKPYVPTK